MKYRAFLLPTILSSFVAGAAVAQGPTPEEWKSLLEEVRSLRERMAEKDRQIDELKNEMERGEERSASTTQLDLELESLRTAVEALEEQREKRPRVRVGGQLRWRFENRIDYDFDDRVDDDIDFSEQRARLHGDFDVAEGLRAFVQFQDVRRWGEERSAQFGTLDDSAEGIDLHQGFATLDVGDRGALRFGRMELSLGKQRLVGALDWAMQGRSFDGIHYNRPICDGDLDAFFFQLQEGAPSTDNLDAQFAGLYYTVHPFPETKKSDLDLYAFFLNDDMRGAKQERWTVGTRFDQAYSSGLFFEFEGALQFGESRTAAGSLDIPFGKVFAYHASVGMQLEGSWLPRVWIEWNHASGDNNSGDDENERFNTLFPTAHLHNGYADLTFWENTRNAALRLQFEPVEGWTVGFDNWYFAVDDPRDFMRGPAFNIPGPMGGPRDAAFESDLTVKWRSPEGISLYAGYSFVYPLEHIERIFGSHDPAHWLFIMLGIDF